MVLNQAKVKSVLSGDSVILCSIAHPDRERTLSLAYCTSPHLKKEGDELWAYESRDALRELLVGKVVQFSVNAFLDKRINAIFHTMIRDR